MGEHVILVKKCVRDGGGVYRLSTSQALHRLFTGLGDKSLGMTEQFHPNSRGRGPGLNKKERAEHRCCHALVLNTMWPATLLLPRLPHVTEGVPSNCGPTPTLWPLSSHVCSQQDRHLTQSFRNRFYFASWNVKS